MRPSFRGHPLGQCDQCGFTVHLSELRKQHDGWRVCPRCFDQKHPQENKHTKPDDQVVMNARHIQTSDEWVFVVPEYPPNTEDL